MLFMHKLGTLVVLVSVGVVLLHAGSAYSQQNWVFERENSGGASVYFSDIFAETPGGIDQLFPPSSVSNEVFAQNGVSVSSQGGSFSAVGIAAGTASILTPIGNSTFIPTVDATLTEEYIAAGPGIGASAGAGAFGPSHIVRSTGIFDVVPTGTAVNAWLHGSFYLVVNPLFIGNAPGEFDSCQNQCTAVVARIGEWYATANWDQFTKVWDVEASLPGGLTVELGVAGVNHYFDFIVPITAGVSDFDFTAEIVFSGRAITDNSNSLSSINIGLSASAWAVITPVGESPLTGDFDGDGDVDDDDLITGWEVNYGANTNTGATVTLSRGDADLDGDVDGSDFLAWQRGFGSSYSTGFGSLESVTQMPEPSTATLAVLCGIVLLNLTSRLKSSRSLLTE